MNLYQSAKDLILTISLLEELGFSNKGFVRGVYGKEHLRLMAQPSGFFIIDKAMNKLNRKPIVTLSDLQTIHEYFLGVSIYG
jgi:hypothetical protein